MRTKIPASRSLVLACAVVVALGMPVTSARADIAVVPFEDEIELIEIDGEDDTLDDEDRGEEPDGGSDEADASESDDDLDAATTEADESRTAEDDATDGTSRQEDGKSEARVLPTPLLAAVIIGAVAATVAIVRLKSKGRS